NRDDVLIEERYQPLVTVIPVDNIEDVLRIALVPENREGFLNKLRKLAATTSEKLIEGSGFSPTIV
ncbi:MAG TPA: ATP-dependent protease LonB, partial [Methanoregulaceae archaeon]|nr:ATP-dependent protease LonB [Methanoregulaceae archaeon]